MLMVGLYTAPGGTLLADYTYKAERLQWSTNKRGDAECSMFVRIGLVEAFQWFTTTTPHLEVSCASSPVYSGRVTAIALNAGGVTFTAVGYSSVFTDAPYTNAWSTTSVAGFQQATSGNEANHKAELFVMDNNNRLFIGTKRGATYQNNTDIGAWYLTTPDNGTQLWQYVQCQYELLAPANWQFLVSGRTVAENGAWSSFVSVATVTATGSLQTGAITVSLSANARNGIAFELYNLTGASSAPAGEDGANYLKITKLRLVTSTTQVASKATTVGTGSGDGAAMAFGDNGVFRVGQPFVISDGTNSQVAAFRFVTSTTTTQADNLSTSYALGATVTVAKVTASAIVKDLLSTYAALNTGLQTDTSGIGETDLDLTDATWEDASAADVLDALASYGDAPFQIFNNFIQYPPSTIAEVLYGDPCSPWYWRVGPDRRLVFQRLNAGGGPNGTSFYTGLPIGAATAWYVDVTTLELERTLETLVNSAYGVYQTSGGTTLRTPVTTDSASVSRYGLTRRQAVNVQTTSAGQAAFIRDTTIEDGASAPPRSKLTFTRVYDSQGNIAFLWNVRAGDTITIRNLPPQLGGLVDQIRTFRLARTTYDATANTLEVEPETPTPTLDFIIARQALSTR